PRLPERQPELVVLLDPLRDRADVAELDAELLLPGAVLRVAGAHALVGVGFELLQGFFEGHVRSFSFVATETVERAARARCARTFARGPPSSARAGIVATDAPELPARRHTPHRGRGRKPEGCRVVASRRPS